jgi:hypothetical protein
MKPRPSAATAAWGCPLCTALRQAAAGFAGQAVLADSIFILRTSTFICIIDIYNFARAILQSAKGHAISCASKYRKYIVKERHGFQGEKRHAKLT